MSGSERRTDEANLSTCTSATSDRDAKWTHEQMERAQPVQTGKKVGMHGRVDMIPGRAGAAQDLRFGYSKFSKDKKDETMLRKKVA